jgi:hypothetical protein
VRPPKTARPARELSAEPALERDEYDNVAFISVRLVRDAAGLPATIIREIAFGEWGRA